MRCPAGIARRTSRISQNAAVASTRRIWLAVAEWHDVRLEASCVLCSLIRFSASPRWQRVIDIFATLVLLLVVMVLALTGAWLWSYFHPRVENVERIVYTQRHGHDLTFDVVRPGRPNGLGVAVMVIV